MGISFPAMQGLHQPSRSMRAESVYSHVSGGHVPKPGTDLLPLLRFLLGGLDLDMCKLHVMPELLCGGYKLLYSTVSAPLKVLQCREREHALCLNFTWADMWRMDVASK
jgi:hypothetical protein